MHSEGILAGELKHGPLALIDKQMPIVMVIMKDPCFAKCQNALQQVTARQVRAPRCPGAALSSSLPRVPTSPPVPASEPVRPHALLGLLTSGTHIPRGTGRLSTMRTTAPE